MKHKIIYFLLVACFASNVVKAQLSCETFIEVTLNEDGEGGIQASSLVNNIEFFIANGTVTYYVAPFTSGVITSGEDIIPIDCNTFWTNQYIIEYTIDGELQESCWGLFTILDPFDSCPNYTFCDDPIEDCPKAVGGYSFYSTGPYTLAAENFAICSNSGECDGTYEIAIGLLSDAENLTYSPTISSDNITEYITPIVLSYSDNGVTLYDNSIFYAWQNLDCFLITESSLSVELDLTAEVNLFPSMFLGNANTCTDVQMAITSINGPEPTDYADEVILGCEDIGYHTVYIKDAATGFVSKCQLLLVDPLEVCGPTLEDGEKLIKISNDPPLGTFANTKVSVNGTLLPLSATGKGWILSEDDLIDGNNTLDFDSRPFQLNGVSTLDLVFLQRIIIDDDFNDPLDAIVMDLDNSGYNGIGDLVLTRSIILGIPNPLELQNVIFKPTELTFPSDFNPFDFDYDFTKYDFDKTNFENESFLFEGYKLGDINGSAVLEDGLVKSDETSYTRDLDVFEVTDMEVEAGVPFTFNLSYDSGVSFKGLLAGLVSNGVTFESLESEYNGEVYYNIINDTELRVSYVAMDLNESIDKIYFEISAVSDKSGKLIDLLSLKPGFPQEVVNENNEVIDIEELEEAVISSIEEQSIETKINAFPNPAYQTVHVTIPQGGIGSIDILDPMGRRILTASSQTNEIIVDVSHLAEGLYFIKENASSKVSASFVKK
ncbi:MAG: T9SS type A sorting domain-containing protein [Saprospiraceae bacterium]|nr:T9SS type A sorting domain-containing protein [Saprospiraceae bacterium]